jgi:amino acid transporter
MNPDEIVGLTVILGIILTILGMYGYEGISASGTRIVEDPKFWQRICISSSVCGITLIVGSVLCGKYIFHITQLG